MSSPVSGDETMDEAHVLPDSPPRPSSTAYSFSGETLQQRHAPVRERLGRAPLFPYLQSPPFVSTTTTTVASSSSNDAPPPPLQEPLPKKREDPAASPSKDSDTKEGQADQGSLFECNICLDTASQPVVTLCGHLFCWPWYELGVI